MKQQNVYPQDDCGDSGLKKKSKKYIYYYSGATYKEVFVLSQARSAYTQAIYTSERQEIQDDGETYKKVEKTKISGESKKREEACAKHIVNHYFPKDFFFFLRKKGARGLV